MTFQPWEKHKITVSENYQRNCNCFFGVDGSQGLRTPEASTMRRFKPVYVIQSTWSHPASNRLLFQAGRTYLHNAQNPGRAPGVSADDIAYIESTTQLQFNSKAQTANGSTDYSNNNTTHLNAQRFAVSYVTVVRPIAVQAEWHLPIALVGCASECQLPDLLNANDVLLHNGRYGPAWLAPSSILGARLFKVATGLLMPDSGRGAWGSGPDAPRVRQPATQDVRFTTRAPSPRVRILNTQRWD